MATAQRSAADPSAVQQATQALLVEEMLRQLGPELTRLAAEPGSSAAADLLPVVMALTQEFGYGAASAALDAYKQHRLAAGLSGSVRMAPVRLPPAAQVTSNVDWSLSGLSDAKALAGGITPKELADIARTKLEGALTRLVLDVGRDQTVDLTQADRKATGWAWIPDAGACYFCLLLASRGAVYKSTSFAASNGRHSGPGRDRAHDHCGCSLQQVYGVYEPSATVRAAMNLYKATPYGASAKEARNNFRVAVKRERDAGNPLFPPKEE